MLVMESFGSEKELRMDKVDDNGSRLEGNEAFEGQKERRGIRTGSHGR